MLDIVNEITDDEIRSAADRWVFVENEMKWSNNDSTVGDNYGSFLAGAKYFRDRLLNSSDKLSLDLINSYEFESNHYQPDYDDCAIDFKLPNGLVLTALTVSSKIPCKVKSLEGLDGYLHITTKTELDRLLTMSYLEILDEVNAKHPRFNPHDWL